MPQLPTPAMTTHRAIDLSDEHKAFIASMTDNEFRRWLFANVDFLACQCGTKGSMVSERIVVTKEASCGLPVSVASRFYLAREYYRTTTYRRIFAEQEVVA